MDLSGVEFAQGWQTAGVGRHDDVAERLEIADDGERFDATAQHSTVWRCGLASP